MINCIPYSGLISRGEIFVDWVVKTFRRYTFEVITKYAWKAPMFENFRAYNFEDRTKSAKISKFSSLEINLLYSNCVQLCLYTTLVAYMLNMYVTHTQRYT